jgi:hypothetical protein
MTEDFAHTSKIVRNADGSFSVVCVDGNGDVHAPHGLGPVAAPVSQTVAAPKE